MATSAIFGDLSLGWTELFVADAAAAGRELAERWSFTRVAERTGAAARSVASVQANARLVVAEGLTATHPAAAHVAAHGDGVADIAFSTSDVDGAYAEALRRGATPLSGPGRERTIHPPRRHATDSGCWPARRRPLRGLRPPGELGPVADFYEEVLDFRTTFTERVVVGAQAMDSRVVQSRSSSVVFTLLEPGTTARPGADRSLPVGARRRQSAAHRVRHRGNTKALYEAVELDRAAVEPVR
ncbi:hypothetical protein L6E12_01350 [Actinokineospora sp. PR83]|uniref:hypothetical protein n=1 Tax=Actinokineospora sp. PR83 TaxID=2884908 RepID=UPI001F2B770F|nr:hypothetical protein [Actinokineospora sp. PR83]MCG8914442.1 hypothetical protein [Actinokineospora sp. PR83]